MKKIKNKMPKLNTYEWEIGRILIDELSGWEYTNKVSIEEFVRLVKRLSKIK